MSERRVRFATMLAVVAFALLLAVRTDAEAQVTPLPDLTAEAWVVMDAESGEILAEENASEELPAGSTTKIMTAFTAFEMLASGEASFDEEVRVSPEAASFAKPIYSNVGLRAGDELNVREMLMATLIASGNDSATALAEHLGEGSVRRFVERMNRDARRLGLRDTVLKNVTGLDAKGHRTSARDLARMARLASSAHRNFSGMVATEYATVTTREREIPLNTENELLSSYPAATGVKTGTTPQAGQCLVASASLGEEEYIIVVLDSQDRYAEAMVLLDHAFSTYDRRDLVQEGARYAQPELPYRRGKTVGLVAEHDLEELVNEYSEVGTKIQIMEDIPGSVKAGTRLGEVVVSVDGERVGEVALLTERGYREASLWEKTWYTIEGIWS
jgi:serine-type D-Ala-D-Ala carboxypeptidase (penicillin-binding protein 5/6)